MCTLHSCTHWQIPMHNPPPRIWGHMRGRYWSANIDDISLWPPVPLMLFSAVKWIGACSEDAVYEGWEPVPGTRTPGSVLNVHWVQAVCDPRENSRAGHSLIFSRFAIRSPLNFFTWIADAHAFIFWISLFARRSNARRSTSGSLSEKGLNHSSKERKKERKNERMFVYPFHAIQ
jgi:hypothetical protein